MSREKLTPSRSWAARLRRIRSQVQSHGSLLVALAPADVECLERLGYRVNVNHSGEPVDGERLCTVCDRA